MVVVVVKLAVISSGNGDSSGSGDSGRDGSGNVVKVVNVVVMVGNRPTELNCFHILSVQTHPR